MKCKSLNNMKKNSCKQQKHPEFLQNFANNFFTKHRELRRQENAALRRFALELAFPVLDSENVLVSLES